jgi:hypothetical protein
MGVSLGSSASSAIVLYGVHGVNGLAEINCSYGGDLDWGVGVNAVKHSRNATT